MPLIKLTANLRMTKSLSSRRLLYTEMEENMVSGERMLESTTIVKKKRMRIEEGVLLRYVFR